MKKLRLNIEEISVDTFTTAGLSNPGRGSVIAHVPTSLADGCTGELYCYTEDPRWKACTGGNPCTVDHRCTNITTCAEETPYCD